MAGMEVSIVGFAGLDHLPKVFEQALAQAAQGTGMAFAFITFLFVVNRGPGADLHAALGPEMDSMAQDFIALVADANAVDLAGLETDRSCSCDAL